MHLKSLDELSYGLHFLTKNGLLLGHSFLQFLLL